MRERERDKRERDRERQSIQGVCYNIEVIDRINMYRTKYICQKYYFSIGTFLAFSFRNRMLDAVLQLVALEKRQAHQVKPNKANIIDGLVACSKIQLFFFNYGFTSQNTYR